MAKFLRYLRIAFSATCLIACVLLCVLWVRSYRWFDQIIGPISTFSVVVSQSLNGQVLIEITDDANIVDKRERKWTWSASKLQSKWNVLGLYKLASPSLYSQLRVVFPYWFLMVLSGVASVAPWIRWRFSLRTLLIATTLVAVGLGAIVYAVS